ncbi:hypothetical protein K438DRAFT_1758101 [Mycena galopus ATCC 62051]|nr:hypothetical protein K438DRAFT_1758101 [Mycena galopus ATCC 62051]
MIGSLATNLLLICLLAVTNWDRIFGLFQQLYLLGSRWVTTPTVLALYGVVLIYLLFAVHAPSIRNNSTTQRRKGHLAPYYDSNGRLQGWVREAPTVSETNVLHVPELQYHSNFSRVRSSPSSPLRISTPPVPPQISKAPPNLSPRVWDGFPDGQFQCHFTRQQAEDTSQLAAYWVSDKLPGRRGSPDALTADKGKLVRHRCAGVIECKAAVCTVQIAPGKDVSRQTEVFCACGSPLRHRVCKVEWSVVFYRDGAIFENSGSHDHFPYTHSLPTSKKKALKPQVFVVRTPIPLQGPALNTPESNVENGLGQSDRQERTESINSEGELDPESPEEVWGGDISPTSSQRRAAIYQNL